MISSVNNSGSGAVSFAEFLTMMGEERKKREALGGEEGVVVEEQPTSTAPPASFTAEAIRNVFRYFDKNTDK